jgi:hypothetical protein
MMRDWRRLAALLCVHLLVATQALCLCPRAGAAEAPASRNTVACPAHAGAAEGAGAPAPLSDVPSRTACPHCDGRLAGALAAPDLPAPSRGASLLLLPPPNGAAALSLEAFDARPSLPHPAPYSQRSVLLRNCVLLI